MRNFLLGAALSITSCVAFCSGAWAATVIFPEKGDVSFTVQVPTGWTSSDDGKGNLNLLPPQGVKVAVTLTVIDNATVVAQSSVAQIAQAALTPTNATAIYKQTPASISGIDGTAFYTSSQGGDGTKFDLKLTILIVKARYIIFEIVGTPTVMTAELETALKSVTKGIVLKVQP
jgi:hypothetical protein